MVSAAAGVMQGLGGAVRARGPIGGSASGLDRGTTLGFCVLEARIDQSYGEHLSVACSPYDYGADLRMAIRNLHGLNMASIDIDNPRVACNIYSSESKSSL